MAKSLRASSRKTNNQRLKRDVFGPVEEARVQRLSAKLQELAAQPKEAKMEDASENPAEGLESDKTESAEDPKSTKMEVDSGAQPSKKQSSRVEKRRPKRSKSSIVFKTYNDKKKNRK